MLDRIKELTGYTLHANDGEIGQVKDFYFDDHFWTIRYLIADAGNWLIGRQVLISPYALTGVNRVDQSIAVNLTRDQIKGSPRLDNDKPISRQYETDYYGYYRWPGYWGGPFSWGPYPYIASERAQSRDRAQGGKEYDHHLRSTHQVTGYHVHAIDGQIGHVEDFIIDDKTWAIRYLIVNTKNWLPGKRVLISPQWIERVNWLGSSVFFNVPRATVQKAPEYIYDSSLSRDYETSLHQHYMRQGYWTDEPVADLLVF
jgi:sporulation protein YlmC with PRC-barrel domain